MLMAKCCDMSTRNLTRKFKDEFGLSPAAMVRKIRLARAQYLLDNTNYSAKRIAKLAGFSSARVMRQCFAALKSDVGMVD